MNHLVILTVRNLSASDGCANESWRNGQRYSLSWVRGLLPVKKMLLTNSANYNYCNEPRFLVRFTTPSIDFMISTDK